MMAVNILDKSASNALPGNAVSCLPLPWLKSNWSAGQKTVEKTAGSACLILVCFLAIDDRWSNRDLLAHGAEVIRQLTLMNKLQGVFLCGFFVFFKPLRVKITRVSFRNNDRREEKAEKKDTYTEKQMATERQAV
ncbi:hypothetical protein [Marinococcus luteus]|uniref:hypothetical protein n=1 Tax=Marinococcus luteus TaxID=1122204 RepID=UPI002ACC6E21|nr:hypothetical protein [Marinococcus luteus]MDZ5783381.1 hypothetical protein [Marinococcus luteus]